MSVTEKTIKGAISEIQDKVVEVSRDIAEDKNLSKESRCRLLSEFGVKLTRATGSTVSHFTMAVEVGVYDKR